MTLRAALVLCFVGVVLFLGVEVYEQHTKRVSAYGTVVSLIALILIGWGFVALIVSLVTGAPYV